MAIAAISDSDSKLPMFNEKANSYSQAAVVQQQLANWLAQWLEPMEQTSSLSALELGSGDGLFTETLSPRFNSLTALDLAPRMVERGQYRLPQVQWQVADGWHADVPAVDRLYSASFLQWCPDPVSVLQHWRTLANQDARMLHGFYVAPTLGEWQTLAPAQSPIHWRSPSEWVDYFHEAGWSVLRSESKKHVQQFDSALDLVRFFHQTGVHTPSRTSIAKLRQAISNYNNNFATAQNPPRVTSTWTFFRIEAAK